MEIRVGDLIFHVDHTLWLGGVLLAGLAALMVLSLVLIRRRRNH